MDSALRTQAGHGAPVGTIVDQKKGGGPISLRSYSAPPQGKKTFRAVSPKMCSVSQQELKAK